MVIIKKPPKKRIIKKIPESIQRFKKKFYEK